MAEIEKAFQKHLEDHKKEDKERAIAERELYQEIVNFRFSIENLPLKLKETFITRDEMDKGYCIQNFRNFISEHEKEKKESGKFNEDFKNLMDVYKKEQMKSSNLFLVFLKNVGWVISSIIGSIFVIGSGIVDKFINS